MDTACLKLKFNPLTQSIKGSRSTYCLEIVPEISCIENFDTLIWKNESEVIKYTIPMTHTITLKKSSFDEYMIHSNKVYHSCVDLLMTDSQGNFDCGDVPRMLSDNRIISHYLNKTLVNENKTRLRVKEDAELLTVYIEDKNSSSQSVISNKIECVYEGTSNTDINASKINNTKQVGQETIPKICSASTNTKHNIAEFSDTEIVRNSSTETDDNVERKLTLSPICSVSTDEQEVAAVLHEINNDENIEAIICPKPIQDLKHDIYYGPKQYQVYDIVKKTKNEVPKVNNRNDKRFSKEAKFESFMRMMEKELQPVHMMFDDIIDKCITLGIHDKMINSKKQKAIEYKFTTNCKDDVTKCCAFDSMCKSKSNRVVYTVTCDG